MKVHELLSEAKNKQKLEPVKPRNFVAKNARATTSGAGAHKDKKKAMKQGDVKHKGKQMAEARYRDPDEWHDQRRQAELDAQVKTKKVYQVYDGSKREYIGPQFDDVKDALAFREKQPGGKDMQVMTINRRVEEAYGRRSSYYNPSDYERDQQRQMDYDKRAFKRAELQHELGHEDDPDFERKLRQQQMDRDRGPWYLKINGKILKTGGQPKVFDWKKGANNYALAILKNKPELQGKIFLTKKGEDDVAEDAGFQALDSWKKEVLQAYPQYAGKIKFLGRDGQVSAEIPGLDRSFGVFDLDTETGEVLGESATAGATSAGNIASVANPHVAIGKDRGKKSYTGSPGKSGTKAPAVPKAVQAKNADGTAKNALDLKGTSVFGGALKR